MADGAAASPEQRARRLVGSMSLRDKLHQMSGDRHWLAVFVEVLRRYNREPIVAGDDPGHGIPGLRFSDGPRGVVMGSSTCFPVAMARGATWDVDLEERIGDAIGVEVRAQGGNFFAGICINLLRHPGWGRAQETYGEDPIHLGEMGAALVRGTQRHVMACIKHYAANSIENSRFRVDVRLGERSLREVYLPHFERCVAEGAASVMGAYNRVNGQWCCHHRELLRDVLKGDWQFEGFTISDFGLGVRDGVEAAEGGLDVEMPYTHRYGRRLERQVKRGRVDPAVIDEAVERIVATKLRFEDRGEPDRYRPEAVAGEAHRALAREAATKSMVLLHNATVDGAPTLPLTPERLERLAVIGRLARADNLGDHGSSQVRPPSVVTPLDGLRAALEPSIPVDYDDGRRLARAVAVARGADAVVLVAGHTHRDEGEYIFLVGGDRERLTLPRREEALIAAVADANPRTVVVLVGGSAILTEAWREKVAALLLAWYPGMEGGHALADLLLGRVSPSGRLPFSVPTDPAHLPSFDVRARTADYDEPHGYGRMQQLGHTPAFAFGFGLSYTTFRYSTPELSPATAPTDGEVELSVSVTNIGPVAADEVVQLYLEGRGGRPVRELAGFRRLSLSPGGSDRARFVLDDESFAHWEPEAGAWVVDPGELGLWVGSSSRPCDLTRVGLTLTGGRHRLGRRRWRPRTASGSDR